MKAFEQKTVCDSSSFLAAFAGHSNSVKNPVNSPSPKKTRHLRHLGHLRHKMRRERKKVLKTRLDSTGLGEALDSDRPKHRLSTRIIAIPQNATLFAKLNIFLHHLYHFATPLTARSFRVESFGPLICSVFTEKRKFSLLAQ